VPSRLSKLLVNRRDPSINWSQPVAIVLGDNLAACRVLRREGVRVAMVNDVPPASGLNGLEFHRCPRYGSPQYDGAWLRSMLSLAKGLGSSGQPVLFPSSDAALLTVARERAALDQAYVVTCSAPELVYCLVSKVGFASWARANGIPTPESWTVRTFGELEQCLNEVPLPCIVKPELTFLLEDYEDTKLLCACTREEVRRFAERILSRDLQVVLQEDLSGARSIQWSLAGVCDPAGNIRQAVLSRKLRQIPWGAGTAMETIPMDEVVLEIGRAACHKLGLRGLFEMELRPAPTGAPQVIEINARIWTQVALPAAAGVNLLHAAYRAATGWPLASCADYRPGVGWVRWPDDLHVSHRQLRKGELSPVAFLRSLLRVRVVG
jgi:predicted ATP-grasp superfamily ATP-dependent carboligase